ncbi:transcriptional regulator, TetR family [Pseudomonas guineae]|uniref:Transcriptional regulator, TetR family n=1 Tax=Pseudomonas guineae TaxID=425504 RepID=A0A1I3DH86_9PSED|nr:TetR/AcrR family transcriptional regulator [Pseudomonas guineae]SFH85861.1 transcriptional regulator, TetR family [Pseudomonas guineae]
MPNNMLPTSGPGRPKDLAKRKAILEAAKALFLSNGYDGSSMDAIAAEAGVSKLTVYSHFTDKEKLFAEAIKSKCEEQLPQLLFELSDEVPVEQALLSIGSGFSELINSRESLELHRVMVTLAAQGSQLSKVFYEAGPEAVLHGMAELLRQADLAGKLRVADPLSAADQFFCLIKGGVNFRLLIGCGEALQGTAAEAHVRDAVNVFLRAYRADTAD